MLMVETKEWPMSLCIGLASAKLKTKNRCHIYLNDSQHQQVGYPNATLQTAIMMTMIGSFWSG